MIDNKKKIGNARTFSIRDSRIDLSINYFDQHIFFGIIKAVDQ